MSEADVVKEYQLAKENEKMRYDMKNRRTVVCRTCGNRVFVVESDCGTRIMLDTRMEPAWANPKGSVRAVNAFGEPVLCDLSGARETYSGCVYIPHHSHCIYSRIKRKTARAAREE